MTRTVLEAYQRHVFHYRKKDGAPLAFTGQQQRLIPLRTWFKWMARQHYILHNPASELEIPRGGFRLPKAVLTAAGLKPGSMDLAFRKLRGARPAKTKSTRDTAT